MSVSRALMQAGTKPWYVGWLVLREIFLLRLCLCLQFLEDILSKRTECNLLNNWGNCNYEN